MSQGGVHHYYYYSHCTVGWLASLSQGCLVKSIALIEPGTWSLRIKVSFSLGSLSECTAYHNDQDRVEEIRMKWPSGHRVVRLWQVLAIRLHAHGEGSEHAGSFLLGEPQS